MFKLSINSVMKTAQIVFTVIFSLTLLSSSSFGQAEPVANMQALVIGKPIERELKSDEAHSYSLFWKRDNF